MNTKILQIIPAPPGLWAKSAPECFPDEIEYFPVFCLALVEVTSADGQTHQSVQTMHSRNDCTVMSLASNGDMPPPNKFCGYVFLDEPPEKWTDADGR